MSMAKHIRVTAKILTWWYTSISKYVLKMSMANGKICKDLHLHMFCHASTPSPSILRVL